MSKQDTNKLSISPPNQFQHVGGVGNMKKQSVLSIPQQPPPLKIAPTIVNNINSPPTESPPKSPHLTHTSNNNTNNNITKSNSNSNLNITATTGGSGTPGLTKSTSNHNLNLAQHIGASLKYQPNKILHHPSPKKTTKSTIISGKLKRFFKSRPSRDSLYENHILSAPHSSATLSFINIFKIITALKKSNALENEGLFRVNGNAESIRSLWLMLNNVQEAIPSDSNPHDLAGLLKLYLRECKFPLIPLELCIPSVPSTIEEAKDFIDNKLPTENLKILSYLVEYLEMVSNKSSLNKMNPIALGVCFAPNSVRSVNANPINPQFQINVSNIQQCCNFITLLIENRSYIFKNTTPPIPTSTPATDDEILSSLIVQSPTDDSLKDSQEISQEEEESYDNDDEGNQNELQTSSEIDKPTKDGSDSPSSQKLSPLYDEFINLLTDDSLGSAQKSIIISRMTTLFTTDGERFKAFLKEMQIDGLISLLEYILTLDEN